MSGAIWVGDKSLTIENKDHIERFILPKLEAETLSLLFDKLEELLELDEVANASKNLSPGKEITALNSIKRNLQTAHGQLAQLEEYDIPEGIDEAYRLENRDSYLENLANIPRVASGVTEVLRRLLSAIDKRNLKLETLKKNGAPNVRRHAYLALSLVIYFQENIPAYKPSSSPDTPFSNLVSYIFKHLLKEPTRNPKRHIDLALKLLAEREREREREQ